MKATQGYMELHNRLFNQFPSYQSARHLYDIVHTNLAIPSPLFLNARMFELIDIVDLVT